MTRETEDVLKELGVSHLSVSWIVDEFDDSFDSLAMGSLRYHLYHSVANNRGEYGDKLKALLDDFEALGAREKAPWESDDWTEHEKEAHPESGNWRSIFNCDDCSQFVRNADLREREWKKEQNALRHRFIDILPGLWS